jgi:predicted enzyme related to lactoylglutathione lyase
MASSESPSSAAELNLIVIFVSDVLKSKLFYEAIGISFQLEQHGRGPEHFSAQLRTMIFEIYPRTEQRDGSQSLRLGFRVASVDDITTRLEQLGATLVKPAGDSPWGRRAILRDPDGYTLELTSPIAGQPV